TTQNDTFQNFANITAALSGHDTKVLIGTLSASSGTGTGSALTILTKDAEDQVVVVVNDLAGHALPLDVSISNTKGRTIDVGTIRPRDNAGGATMAREIQSSLSGFVDVTIRDAHGKVVLRGTLQAQTAVASPTP